jgi:hypothetical protein
MKIVLYVALIVMLLAYAPWIFFPIAIYALWRYAKNG